MLDMSEILGRNPLYHVFSSPNGLAWVVMVAGVIAIFAVRGRTATASTIIGTVLSLATAVGLTIENSYAAANETPTGVLAVGAPYVMGVAGLTLLAFAVMAARSSYRRWAKVTLISTYSLCAALAGLFGSQSVQNWYAPYSTSSTQWFQWLTVKEYMWGMAFVLMVTTAFMLLIGFIAFGFTRRQQIKSSMVVAYRWASVHIRHGKTGRASNTQVSTV